MVHVEGLYKSFEKDVPVLRDINFSVGRAETLAIVGPSGCGKTTLLYILAGLLAPSAGSVRIDDGKAGRSPGKTGFILQDFGLLPWRTVWENVCLGMKIQGMNRPRREQRAAGLLEELGLLPHRDRFPDSLSGGEKQRIAIGRALATDPDLLLMDEPFSSLDAITRENLQNTLLDISIKRGLTVILVTHSIEEAVFLGRSVMVLGTRPGSIRAVVDNQHAGAAGFREEGAFYETCKQVRRAFEGS
ncbi:MAG: ATP-binding cassette domain-containing protein [Syntrophorhabdales bacterium]